MSFATLGRFVIPDVVATQFHLHEGDVVADLGAGTGYFMSALATAVGSTGRVIACEIQKPLVEKLGTVARQHGYTNVDVLWCDLEELGGVKVKDQSLDAAILVNTFFQLEDKRTAIDEFHRILRTGGVIHVIDWSESYSGLGPATDQVVSKDDTIDLFETNGFVLEREYAAGDHHYGLTFRAL